MPWENVQPHGPFQLIRNGIIANVGSEGARLGMIRSFAFLVVAVAMVSACGRVAESRFNPLNWFGGDRETRDVAPATEASDPRPVVDQVIQLSVDEAPGGAVVRAVGLPATQGHWAAALVPEARQTLPGVLTFTFRIVPPASATRISTQQSREVVAATFLSDQSLAGVREIRVLGARASRSVRR